MQVITVSRFVGGYGSRRKRITHYACDTVHYKKRKMCKIHEEINMQHILEHTVKVKKDSKPVCGRLLLNLDKLLRIPMLN